MLKIILPVFFMSILMNNLPFLIIILSLMLMLTLSTIMSSLFPYINSMMFMDMTAYLMVILTLISILLISLSSSMLKKVTPTIIPILIILMMTFTFSNMINFYIMFELVLIPTMILIMMNGKQPERLQASVYLIMYTILASLPLLTSIIFFKNNPSFLISLTSMMKFNIPMFLMMAFLVKSPMYFTHLWLPKAHVEAPLEGSMILAAVLLKLGGYGVIRFVPLCFKKMMSFNYWIISISLIGAYATSLNCTRQKDLKSLIAYSSVAHMGMVITALFTMNSIGLTGAIIMMIAHGLSSSALFFLVNDLYMKYHTRNMLLFKGLISILPNITFWWFMFMAVNISAPPTINTLSEILIMSSLINWNISTMMFMFIMSIATTSFSMMMYVNISHNNLYMKYTNQSPQKTHLSLFLHLIPLILILMKSDMIMILYI